MFLAIGISFVQQSSTPFLPHRDQPPPSLHLCHHQGLNSYQCRGSFLQNGSSEYKIAYLSNSVSQYIMFRSSKWSLLIVIQPSMYQLMLLYLSILFYFQICRSFHLESVKNLKKHLNLQHEDWTSKEVQEFSLLWVHRVISLSILMD